MLGWIPWEPPSDCGPGERLGALGPGFMGLLPGGGMGGETEQGPLGGRGLLGCSLTPQLPASLAPGHLPAGPPRQHQPASQLYLLCPD